MGVLSRSTAPKAIGAAVATAALVALQVPWPIALLAGVGGFAIAVLVARRTAALSGSVTTKIDPFSIGEPWRQFVQGAQKSASKLHTTVEDATEGPLKDRMSTIVTRLDDGLAETWMIARRGDQIDDTVRRLDPVALRSKLASLRTRLDATPSSDLEAAITSVESQIESTERLKAESNRTADTLRLAQTRFDELVSRAAEVGIGAGDTDAYEHDVDDLVIELESLRQAVEETNRP